MSGQNAELSGQILTLPVILTGYFRWKNKLIFILIDNQKKVVKYYNNMLSNILREKNFNVRQLSHTVCHKAHGHAFGLRVN
jgi:hypothetical protein